jgi:thiol-disulfide isomerase/thioredoxin
MDDLPEERPHHPIRSFVGTIVSTLVLGLVLNQGVGWLRAPDLPEQAPTFAVTTLDGQQLDLAALRGRKVVLNFWATWCGPCRLESPFFASFAAANPDIVVLGLAEDDDPALVQRTMASLGIRYPVALASDQLLATYQVNTFPTTVVINEDGTVRAAHTGMLSRPQLWAMTR